MQTALPYIPAQRLFRDRRRLSPCWKACPPRQGTSYRSGTAHRHLPVRPPCRSRRGYLLCFPPSPSPGCTSDRIGTVQRLCAGICVPRLCLRCQLLRQPLRGLPVSGSGIVDLRPVEGLFVILCGFIGGHQLPRCIAAAFSSMRQHGLVIYEDCPAPRSARAADGPRGRDRILPPSPLLPPQRAFRG